MTNVVSFYFGGSDKCDSISDSVVLFLRSCRYQSVRNRLELTASMPMSDVPIPRFIQLHV